MSTNKKMSNKDLERYKNLKHKLCEIGPIRRGTIHRRLMRCGKPKCRCRASPPALHGPYYQWTRKIGGKTVNRTLNHEEAVWVQEWIRNGKQLDRIVALMEKICLRMTDDILRGLKPD